MKAILAFSLVAISIFQAQARADDRIGKIYALDDSKKAEPLFVVHMHRESKDGFDLVEANITDPQNKIVMVEHAKIKDGKVLFQRTDQLQINESFEVELKDGQMNYRSYKMSGAERTLTKEKSHDLHLAYVTGPMAETFLKDALLKKGAPEKISADFGVLEIQRSVEFEFNRREPTSVAPETPIHVRMKPANFFFSMMVDPIDLYFDRGSLALVEYKGRVPLKHMVDGKWKPLDADVIYSDVVAKK